MANDVEKLVTGAELATPRVKAEQEVAKLLIPATKALRTILEMDMRTLEKDVAASAALKTQLEAARMVIDGCLGMAAIPGGKSTRDAKAILASVGGDAVTRELAKRYAMREKAKSERARFVEAVPAQSEELLERKVDAVMERVRREQDALLDVAASEQLRGEGSVSADDTATQRELSVDGIEVEATTGDAQALDGHSPGQAP